jgi:hypothetical protein
MFVIIGIIGIPAWFYISASKIGKRKFLWSIIGFLITVVLGFLFLKFSGLYILHKESNLTDAFNNNLPKKILSSISMVLILGYAYIIKSIFLSKKKSEEL